MMAVLFLVGRHLEDETIVASLLDVAAVSAKPVYDLAPEDGLVLYAATYPELDPKLKGSIGEGSNHSNFSHQSSVKILSKFNAFC